jgi:hypothetical protein
VYLPTRRTRNLLRCLRTGVFTWRSTLVSMTGSFRDYARVGVRLMFLEI